MIAKVYLNSQSRRWSVVDPDTRHVRFTPNVVLLRDVTFLVSAAGRARSLRIGRKTVHAWAHGELVCMSTHPLTLAPDVQLHPIRYDRTGAGAFVSSSGVTVASAALVYCTGAGELLATSPVEVT